MDSGDDGDDGMATLPVARRVSAKAADRASEGHSETMATPRMALRAKAVLKDMRYLLCLYSAARSKIASWTISQLLSASVRRGGRLPLPLEFGGAPRRYA